VVKQILLDYYELLKPRVVLLMIITSAIGMLLAMQAVNWSLLIMGNLGIALMAGSAACFNHIIDQKVDRSMQRTQNRPLAKQRVPVINAIVYAAVIGCLGFICLVSWANWLAAYLTLLSLVGYALIYTMYLKRATPQNIVIGGLAGSTPPLLGWVCVTNQVDPQALVLALIIFVWTPPHFWALALYRLDDYKNAAIPMLPSTHGVKYTQYQMIYYCVLLLVVSILPWLMQMFGLVYLIVAVILGCIFLGFAIQVLRYGAKQHKLNMQMFQFSIIYLALLFSTMLIDQKLL